MIIQPKETKEHKCKEEISDHSYSNEWDLMKEPTSEKKHLRKWTYKKAQGEWGENYNDILKNLMQKKLLKNYCHKLYHLGWIVLIWYPSI